MGEIVVHEFISLDGVIENPRFTFGYPFDPRMGTAIARIMGDRGLEELDCPRSLQRRSDPQAQGPGRRRNLRRPTHPARVEVFHD